MVRVNNCVARRPKLSTVNPRAVLDFQEAIFALVALLYRAKLSSQARIPAVAVDVISVAAFAAEYALAMDDKMLDCEDASAAPSDARSMTYLFLMR